MATPSTARVVIVLLTVVALALTLLMLRPFWGALFMAAAFAALLNGWMERLSGWFGGRRGVAAGLLTLLVLLAVVVPLTFVATVLIGDVIGGVRWVTGVLQGEGVEGLIVHLPAFAQPYVRDALSDLPGTAAQIGSLVSSRVNEIASAAGGLLSAAGGALFQTFVFLVGLFFLLMDGPAFVAWLDDVVPLKAGQLSQLLAEFRKTTVVLIVSSLATAGAQSLAALVGFLIAGVPEPLFFAVANFVLSFVPGLGVLLTLCLAALKFMTGSIFGGVFLLIWSFAVVGTLDNIIKPLLVRGQIPIRTGPVLFGLLGGVIVFGAVGVIAGPLIIAFLLSVSHLLRDEFKAGEQAQPVVRQPSQESVD